MKRSSVKSSIETHPVTFTYIWAIPDFLIQMVHDAVLLCHFNTHIYVRFLKYTLYDFHFRDKPVVHTKFPLGLFDFSICHLCFLNNLETFNCGGDNEFCL